MKRNYLYSNILAAAVSALLVSAAGATETDQQTRDTATARSATSTDTQANAKDAQEQVNEALRVVQTMKKDQRLTGLLERAQGVLIAPDYMKAAVGVGGRGGEGVLLLKRDGQWSGPAFYNFGRVSAGLQAGASAGSVAMLLMTQDAVQPFTSQKNNFALDATAGLTVVDYSAERQATAGEPDVILWSDTAGLFAGASVGVSGFVRDEEENRAYYRKQATTREIFSGTVKNPHADALRDALPARTASR